MKTPALALALCALTSCGPAATRNAPSCQCRTIIAKVTEQGSRVAGGYSFGRGGGPVVYSMPATNYLLILDDTTTADVSAAEYAVAKVGTHVCKEYPHNPYR